MRQRMLIVALAIGGLGIAVAAASSSSSAQDNAAVIKQRAALMKEQGRDMGAVHGFLDGKADAAKATAAATDLGGTMAKIPDVFPAGSGGTSPDGKYATKPEIWTDSTGFLAARDAAAKRVVALSDALKGGDKAAVQTAFADLGKNGCGGCHSKFREEIKK
jgi:cytochrome c556